MSVSASLGFLIGLREEFLHNLPIVAGLAVGGVIAAPFAAWLVTKVSPALLGTLVGGIIILTNSQKLIKYFGITGAATTIVYLAILVSWAALIVYTWRSSRAPAYVPDALADEVAQNPEYVEDLAEIQGAALESQRAAGDGQRAAGEQPVVAPGEDPQR